jgi:protein Mpv17
MLQRLRPILKASLTSGSVFILGDITNQLIQKHGDSEVHKKSLVHTVGELNWNQTMQFGFIGFTLHGPYFRKGLQYLDKWFGTTADIKAVLLKSIAGQFIIFPPYVAMYLAYSSVLNGRDPIRGILDQFPRIVTNGVLVWPFANVINFRFIPMDYRLLYINAVGVGWNSYISWETFNNESH